LVIAITEGRGGMSGLKSGQRAEGRESTLQRRES
jgi:hypothetical protein